MIETKQAHKAEKKKRKRINSKREGVHDVYHDDDATAAVTGTDVEVEEVLKCELWMSDSANSLKSCFEHDRPG